MSDRNQGLRFKAFILQQCKGWNYQSRPCSLSNIGDDIPQKTVFDEYFGIRFIKGVNVCGHPGFFLTCGDIISWVLVQLFVIQDNLYLCNKIVMA